MAKNTAKHAVFSFCNMAEKRDCFAKRELPQEREIQSVSSLLERRKLNDKPRNAKRLKVYELYDSGFGSPTCQSSVYAVRTRHVWHVVALTVKQAYYLAANNLWQEQDGDGTGIVEERTDSDPLRPWLQADGTTTEEPQFRYRQTFSQRPC